MKSSLNVFLVLLVLMLVLGCGLGSSDETGNADNTEAATTTADGGDVEFDSNDDNSEDDGADPRETPGNRSFTVKFAKGGTSRSYKNSVTLGSAHTYSLGAKKGQVLKVGISSTEKNAVFEVFSPAGSKLSDGEDGNMTFTRPLAADGNYKIKVSGTRGTAAYNVSFSVTGRPDGDDVDGDEPIDYEDPDDSEAETGSGGLTKTVKFARGRSSASYKDAVIRAERNTYILGAKAGQQMTVSITSLENNAVFQIRGPRGYLPGIGPGTDRTSWSGPLPADGKYQIIVGGTRGNATYTVNFAIR